MQIVQTSQLKENMITAAPVTTKHGLLIVDKGRKLTNSLIAHIAFYEVEHVEVEDFAKPSANATKHTSEPTYSQRITSSAKFQSFQEKYSKALLDLKEALTGIIAKEFAPEPNRLVQIIQPLLSEAPTSIERFDFLHNMRKIDDSIYAHSLDVALISDMLGRWLKMSDEDLTLLTAAALLHDIGKSQIPEEILNKPGKYTDEEFLLVRKHPTFGYEMLLPYEQLDPRIKNAALMHHERCDGKGYPQGLKHNAIDSFAQMIAIADVYDAMTAARAYRTPLCPFQVIADFEIEGLQKYNPKYILIFLEHIAYTYQNNRVLLTDGRSANIIMLNKQFLSRPIVETEDGIVDLSKTADIRIQSLL